MSYKKCFSPCDECRYSYSKNGQQMSECNICEFNHYKNLEDEGRLMEVVYGFNKYDYDSAFECSVCGFVDWDTLTSDDVKYNYCPRCGAKIDKEKAEAKLAETEGAE